MNKTKHLPWSRYINQVKILVDSLFSVIMYLVSKKSNTKRKAKD